MKKVKLSTIKVNISHAGIDQISFARILLESKNKWKPE